MALFDTLEAATDADAAYHVWIVSYGISMGRNMWLAVHDGTFVNRVELFAKGCTYWRGPLEGGPWRLQIERRVSVVDGEDLVETRLFDRDGGFELSCESLRIERRDLVASNPSMTIDLDPIFHAGREPKGDWSVRSVWIALEQLADATSKIDWEPGDEQWGTVFGAIDGVASVVGHICARLPIGFVHEGIDSSRLSQRVTWLRFSSYDEHVYRVDRKLLEEIFGRSMTDVVDYSAICLQELWYATIT